MNMGNQKARWLILHLEGMTLHKYERRVLPMITYEDLFLFCTFIVALISLLYQIFKGKK